MKHLKKFNEEVDLKSFFDQNIDWKFVTHMEKVITEYQDKGFKLFNVVDISYIRSDKYNGRELFSYIDYSGRHISTLCVYSNSYRHVSNYIRMNIELRNKKYKESISNGGFITYYIGADLYETIEYNDEIETTKTIEEVNNIVKENDDVVKSIIDRLKQKYNIEILGQHNTSDDDTLFSIGYHIKLID